MWGGRASWRAGTLLCMALYPEGTLAGQEEMEPVQTVFVT